MVSGSLKILLVEDDLAIRQSIQEILELENHKCIPAENGWEAKTILESSSDFDLLITDFRMPKMDGVELLHWCRSQSLHFPVIFITANDNLITQEKNALKDYDAVLLKKPLHIDELLKVIYESQKQAPNKQECALS